MPRIVRMISPPVGYHAISYLVLGEPGSKESRPALVDATISALHWPELDQLMQYGAGKALAAIVLTHEHYDHCTALEGLCRRYGPRVFAQKAGPFVTDVLYDNQWLRLGDSEWRVIFTPGHSADSLCLFCPESGDCFVGDTPFIIQTPGGSHPREFLASLKRLAQFPIRCVYFGHHEPMILGIAESLENTIRIVEQCVLV